MNGVATQQLAKAGEIWRGEHGHYRRAHFKLIEVASGLIKQVNQLMIKALVDVGDGGLKLISRDRFGGAKLFIDLCSRPDIAAVSNSSLNSRI